MKKTIGILGGMGPLATADLFRKIVTMTKAGCDNDHIRIYIDDNASIPDRTAAILATKGTLATGLYEEALKAQHVAYLVPDAGEQDALMRVIYGGVKADAAPETYRADMEGVLATLAAKGADYFILGCTELPLAAAVLGSASPTVDPTEELARTAIRFCGYNEKDRNS